MRKFLYFVLLLLVIFVSCSKDSDEIKPNYPYHALGPYFIVGTLIDGQGMTGFNLKCLHNSTYDYSSSTYYHSIKTLSDYSQLNLYFVPEYTSNPYQYGCDSIDVHNILWSNDGNLPAYSAYKAQKVAFMTNAYNEFAEKHEEIKTGAIGWDWIGWVAYLTSYADGPLKITCDKKLFGLEPGEDLSSYFSVQSSALCIPKGIENPYLAYGFEEGYKQELPTNIDAFFSKETWIQSWYYRFYLETYPTERYEDAVFNFTLPVANEKLCSHVIAATKGSSNKPFISHKVYTADCQVKFNWK